LFRHLGWQEAIFGYVKGHFTGASPVRSSLRMALNRSRLADENLPLWAPTPSRRADWRTLGGRAAEKLVYGVVTTGAENDLQQVTEIARHMVLRWGMSEKLGPISFVARQDEGLPPAFQHQPYSEATSELIDAEVRCIVEESHREADRLLAEHREQLEALAQALLKAESLNEKELRDVTRLSEPPGHKEDTSSRLRTGKG
jgi:hypothetical protein